MQVPIYKLNHIINGKVDTIYVLNGKKQKQEKDLHEFFSEKELENIKNNKIKVKSLEQIIYFDDSIGTIKLKIMSEFQKTISIDEIYLYCQKLESFNSVSVFQSLTQNKKLPLTKVRLDQFISNIVCDENGNKFTYNVEKDVYDYDDVVQMNLDGKKFIVNKVLGQKFFMIENEYPFVCNPFDVQSYDSFLERNSRKSLTTLNSHLLLNSGDIINNNIYLCLAKDVLDFDEKTHIPENLSLKIYYPFLYEKNINNKSDLMEKQESLIRSNDNLLNANTYDYFKTIEMFYDIYKLRKSELNYVNKGIKFIKAVIKPLYIINIPLEIIFKILHSTRENPLIKYNPSSRQENIYRLFTDKIATDGRKIPYLKKATIFKLIKNIGKTKSVSVYIEIPNNSNITLLICEFDENGFITILSELENAINENEINTLFVNHINPIIQEITNLLEQSGYKINLFDNIKNNNIEIKQLTYQTQIKIKSSINLDLYRGCISSIFNNESSSYKKDIHLRFKRVANFNKRTSQEAFILEKSLDGYRGDEIIEALLDNFPDDLTRNDAEELVKKVANEIQLERGIKKTDIKIKDNPGFKTVIYVDPLTGIITINVENINDIQYLATIPIYIDSMIRITQDKKSTKYSTSEIDKLCSTGEKVEIIIPDIISPVESEASELEIPSIEDEDSEIINYTKLTDSSNLNEEDKGKNAFDLFFDDDELENMGDSEESIESAEITGGESSKTSESEESISSATVDSETSAPGIESPPIIEENVGSENYENKESNEEQYVSDNNDDEEAEVEEEPAEEEAEIEDEHAEEEAEVEESEIEDEPVEEEADEEEELEENILNIDNLSLKKKNPYFETRIERLDPVLIIKEDSKEFNSYSRVCSSSEKRQPVILTDKELSKINKDHPGFLRDEDVIKYGSDPNKEFNYICPRYWCLKNNTIVDPKDIKEVMVNGKKELESPDCGYVLPEDAKTVKPGYYVYEFYKPKPGKKNYKKYPGFQTDKHPKGYCLPCCFEKYNTIGRIKANEKCYQNKDQSSKNKNMEEIEKNKDENISKKIHEKELKEDEYIKGPDKFPLLPGKWGYLPLPIQSILNEVNADCQISKTNTNIKPDHPCLLRHGIEISDKQSFVASISDALFFGQRVLDKTDKNITKIAKILSIKEMKERIIKSFNLDEFITYQNGNLVNDFKNSNPNLLHNDSTIENDKYSNTKLYSKINQSNPEELLYFKKIIGAYENFISYLRDDDAIIDHTYLWDIVCKPNKYLFPNGINLIILKIPNDDITNNVDLVCPTNHYSSEFYEARKPTLFLMKEDNYYEPIYSYTNKNNTIKVSKEFKELDPHLSSSMRTVFREIIKPFISEMCKPLNSMPNVYKSRRATLLTNLIQKLDNYDYTVIKMVMNFNNKIIGVIAESPTFSKTSCFVPCYPSSFNEKIKADIDFVFMTDLSLWRTYEETITFLNKLYKTSKKKNESLSEIPCKPILKVLEDELVVGIITETNQFIQISQPIPEIDIKEEYNLPSLTKSNYLIKRSTTTNTNDKNSNNYIQSDAIITTSNDVDNERVEYIKKIKFETQFFNIFRNTIRIMLNDYQNIKIREKIESELLKDYVIYSKKLNNIYSLLRELVNDKIKFIGDDKYYKLIDEVTTCLVKDKESCIKSSNLCMLSETNQGNQNICSLILPKHNLITNKKNETIYFGKMADELIRYNRIKSFILQPQTFLSFGNIGYNLHENEIIMLQSLLTQEYFESLIPAIINTYVKYNSYDEVEPVITQTYDNTAIEKDTTSEVCNKTINDKISSAFWQNCFPKHFKQIEYSKTVNCTFLCIIDIIEKRTGEKFDINKIKEILSIEYKSYLNNYFDKIVDILIIEGKKNLGDKVKSEILSFVDFLYNDNYFLTTFDLWLLVNKFKIPTIFISTKNILQTNYQKNIFVAYSDYNGSDNVDEKFCFILIPVLHSEIIPVYKVIENKNDIFISINDIKINTNKECVDKIELAIKNKLSINTYLENFVKQTKKITKRPIKVTNLAFENDDIENVVENVEVEPIKKKRTKKVDTKFIIEPSVIEPEDIVIVNNKTKKNKKIVLRGKGKTRKN